MAPCAWSSRSTIGDPRRPGAARAIHAPPSTPSARPPTDSSRYVIVPPSFLRGSYQPRQFRAEGSRGLEPRGSFEPEGEVQSLERGQGRSPLTAPCSLARDPAEGAVWNHFQYSVRSSQSSSGPAGGASDGYGLGRVAGSTTSCGPGPPVYDFCGRGPPSHRLGWIHPYVRSCSATGTDRERSDWRT